MTHATSTVDTVKFAAGRSGSRRTRWVANTFYILTTLLIAGWCGYGFVFDSPAMRLVGFTEDDKLPDAFASAQLQLLGLSLLLTATQLVFLVPFARRRIHRVVSGFVIGALVVEAGLQMLFAGWLGLIGGIGLKPGEAFPTVSWAALTTASAIPTIALASGAAIVRLSIAPNPRPRSAMAVFIAMLLLLGFVMPLAGLST